MARKPPDRKKAKRRPRASGGGTAARAAASRPQRTAKAPPVRRKAASPQQRALDEALARERATSDVLRIIAASPGRLEPVFEAILENARRLCDAKFAALNLIEGDTVRSVAHLGVPAAAVEKNFGIRRTRPGPLSAMGRLMRTKARVHIPDLKAERAYKEGEPIRRATVDLGGARSLLAVPMLKKDELIGAIVIYRREVRPFTARQIALVENFAAQAVIAIENARLLTELRESLDRQTATSEVLGAISSSPGELQPVFKVMLANALRLCEAQCGLIFRIDANGAQTLADLGVPPALAAFRRSHPPTGGPGTMLDEMLATKKAVHVHDAKLSKAYLRGHPTAVAAIDLGEMGTVLYVPMLKGDTVIGAVNVFRREVRPFGSDQIELVQNFAAQAVIAIENARLLTELRARTDELARSIGELKALGDVIQAVNSTLELETVLTAIVSNSVRLSQTEAGAIYVFDGGPGEFRPRATHGMDEHMIEAISGRQAATGASAIREAAGQRAPLQIADLRDEPPNPLIDLIIEAGFRAVLVIPLLRPDRALGALVVRRREPGAFAASTIELLETFAARSVVAIQNARLFAEIEEKGRELAEASQHKSQFLANMSHELRTPLNAILGYTKLILDDIYGAAPAKMREVMARVQSNGKHLLGLINDVLDLSKIEAGQLVLSLADYSVRDMVQGVFAAVEPLASTKGLSVKLDVPAGLAKAHGDERRLAQVLLNLVGNALKFTDAGEIRISAGQSNGTLTVAVSDTGPGIAAADQQKIFDEFQQADNAQTKAKGGTGLGLAISRRIVEMHGGRI